MGLSTLASILLDIFQEIAPERIPELKEKIECRTDLESEEIMYLIEKIEKNKLPSWEKL